VIENTKSFDLFLYIDCVTLPRRQDRVLSNKAPRRLDVAAFRREVPAGRFTGQTAGQAPDLLQGNLVILPLEYAGYFLVYCMNNPKPCPVIGFSGSGDPHLLELGDIDIRSSRQM
jgi:uncharacterized protein YcsI (UPF0317 family)